jgi:hypothetical protein
MCLGPGFSPFVVSIVCPVPFACFYLPVCLVPCLLPISESPPPCLLSFFPFSMCPFARGLFPLPASVCPHARLAALLTRSCLPVWRAGPLYPPGPWASWPPPASEKWQTSSSQTQTLPRVAAQFPRQMGRGACLLAQSQQPPSRLSVCWLCVRARALSLTHCLTLSFVQSVDCVPIVVQCFAKRRCVGEEGENRK